MTNFVDLSREELTNRIIAANDPDLVGDETTCIIIGLRGDEGTGTTVQLENGVYSMATIDWNYWDQEESPEFTVITREQFHELIRQECNSLPLNMLRMDCKTLEYSQGMVNQRNRYKKSYHKAMQALQTAIEAD